MKNSILVKAFPNGLPDSIHEMQTGTGAQGGESVAQVPSWVSGGASLDGMSVPRVTGYQGSKDLGLARCPRDVTALATSVSLSSHSTYVNEHLPHARHRTGRKACRPSCPYKLAFQKRNRHTAPVCGRWAEDNPEEHMGGAPQGPRRLPQRELPFLSPVGW